MKRLKVVHKTVYDFSEEVFIEPHYLRFKPRTTPYNHLEVTSVEITPEPTGKIEQIDSENNSVQFCWFHGIHRGLVIDSESVLALEENNPYDFIVFPESAAVMPFDYSPMLKSMLGATLITTKIEAGLIEYGRNIMETSSHQTVGFVTALTEQIHNDFVCESRLEGAPHKPDQTFLLKKGSCRDLSWMQIQLLRQLGIAARFVSGYYFIESESAVHDLHAWVEVYIPGAGWLGFDPSHGAVAGSSHIPVCSSAYHQSTMPVTGSFRGDANSTIRVSLSIEKIK